MNLLNTINSSIVILYIPQYCLKPLLTFLYLVLSPQRVLIMALGIISSLVVLVCCPFELISDIYDYAIWQSWLCCASVLISALTVLFLCAHIISGHISPDCVVHLYSYICPDCAVLLFSYLTVLTILCCLALVLHKWVIPVHTHHWHVCFDLSYTHLLTMWSCQFCLLLWQSWLAD